jgi:hypothetical protein
VKDGSWDHAESRLTGMDPSASITRYRILRIELLVAVVEVVEGILDDDANDDQATIGGWQIEYRFSYIMAGLFAVQGLVVFLGLHGTVLPNMSFERLGEVFGTLLMVAVSAGFAFGAVIDHFRSRSRR